MHAKTAAHKTLPLGTHLHVLNMKNGKSIQVMINDRGPFVKGRILDLSYYAAKELDIVNEGTALVKIKALGQKNISNRYNFQTGNFTIQIGAFRDKNNAVNRADKLKGGYIVTYNTPAGKLYRVRIGHFTNLIKAKKACKQMEAHGFTGAFVISE